MRVGEILADVKTRMPNAFEEDSLLTWLDSAVRELYKELGVRDGFTFTAMGGQTIYPIPSDIRAGSISAVVVGKKEMAARRIGDENANGWFAATEGFIGLHPEPKGGEKITIWYFVRPQRLLSAAEAEAAGIAFAEQEIRLDDDFEELVKLSLCIAIAEAREDVALANNYKVSYNMLLARARQEKYGKDGKYPVTRILQK